MIQPDEIHRKAQRLYPQVLRAWLDGDESFFPRLIPTDKSLDRDDLAGAIDAVRRLREGSKEIRGFGYTIEWSEPKKSRNFGENRFPERILFETRDDLLRLINRRREFETFTGAVATLRAAFGQQLDGWIRSNVRPLIDLSTDVPGLIDVVEYFREHPRPNLFARELPLPVDTKFIERHKGVLGAWIDKLLPHAVRADEEHFERRYGLRYKEPHFKVRFLDSELQRELGFRCSEVSLPLHTLGELHVRSARAFLVENEVNLLTFPAQERGIGLCSLGGKVRLMRYVPWLETAEIWYWGDLDVAGFEILSGLRKLFPQTRSFFMDAETLERFPHLVARRTHRKGEEPSNLTDGEQAAYRRCREENIWLEQERIPQESEVQEFNSLRV